MHAKRVRDSQAGAQIVGIGHPVQDQQQRLARRTLRPRPPGLPRGAPARPALPHPDACHGRPAPAAAARRPATARAPRPCGCSQQIAQPRIMAARRGRRSPPRCPGGAAGAQLTAWNPKMSCVSRACHQPGLSASTKSRRVVSRSARTSLTSIRSPKPEALARALPHHLVARRVVLEVVVAQLGHVHHAFHVYLRPARRTRRKRPRR